MWLWWRMILLTANVVSFGALLWCMVVRTLGDSFLDKLVFQLALLRSWAVVTPMRGGFERRIEDAELGLEKGGFEVYDCRGHCG